MQAKSLSVTSEPEILCKRQVGQNATYIGSTGDKISEIGSSTNGSEGEVIAPTATTISPMTSIASKPEFNRR